MRTRLLADANRRFPYIEVMCLPTRSLRDEIESLEDLQARVSRAEFQRANTTFPGIKYSNGPVNVEGGTEWKIGSTTTWFADRRGAFFYLHDMEPALRDPRDKGKLYVWHPFSAIVRNLEFASRYYGAFGADVDLRIRFLLGAIEKLRLADGGMGILDFEWPGDTAGRAMVDQIPVEIETSAAKLAAGWELEAQRAIRDVFEAFNVDQAKRRTEQWMKTVPGARVL